MRLRTATIDDIDGIVTVLLDSWKKGYASFISKKFLNAMDADHQRHRHRYNMENKIIYKVAVNDCDQILGFTSFGPSRIEAFARATEIYNLYVGPRSQRSGIGTQLLNTLIKPTNSPQGMVVTVFQDSPYKSFYLKHGFIKVGEEKLKLADGFEYVTEILVYL